MQLPLYLIKIEGGGDFEEAGLLWLSSLPADFQKKQHKSLRPSKLPCDHLRRREN